MKCGNKKVAWIHEKCNVLNQSRNTRSFVSVKRSFWIKTRLSTSRSWNLVQLFHWKLKMKKKIFCFHNFNQVFIHTVQKTKWNSRQFTKQSSLRLKIWFENLIYEIACMKFFNFLFLQGLCAYLPLFAFRILHRNVDFGSVHRLLSVIAVIFEFSINNDLMHTGKKHD